MATSPIDQIRSAVDEFGVTTAICYLADQALARLGGRFRVCDYDIMVQPIADSDKAPANLTKSFTIREIEEGDPLVAQMPPPPAIIEARYRQDYVCIGGFQKDDFIGYQWFAFGPYEEDEVRCQFLPTPKETAVFDFDFYLLPEHRLGLGLLPCGIGPTRCCVIAAFATRRVGCRGSTPRPESRTHISAGDASVVWCS